MPVDLLQAYQMMKSAARIVGIFLLQFVALYILQNVIGNHFNFICIGIKSRSCDDNLICLGQVIGLLISGTLLALLLLIRPARRSTIWSLAIALALLDGIAVTHMSGPSCM
jgi:hypothetical protein